MKVALIHDHLAQDGGAEKVLKVLSDIYPNAPIYTLLFDKKYIENNFKGKDIRTSIIHKLPGGIKHYKWYMPLMPMAVEFYDLSDFDVVISSASAFAKGVITRPETLHICYCHTPTRYLWSDTHQYIRELKYNKYFKKIISLVLNYVRIWDKAAADRVDVFVANSKTVQNRIKKYYRRSSKIIYPSFEGGQFSVSSKIGDYYLSGCRLVPYKRVDSVVEAFKKNGLKLKVFGDGIDMPRLKKISEGFKNIELLGRVSDAEKAKLYSQCIAYINPQKEDFGITMVEAMASGRPVIALNQGGAREIVDSGVTGEFFQEESSEAIVKAVENFNQSKYEPEQMIASAQKYSTENFCRSIKDLVDSEFSKFNSNL